MPLAPTCHVRSAQSAPDPPYPSSCAAHRTRTPAAQSTHPTSRALRSHTNAHIRAEGTECLLTPAAPARMARKAWHDRQSSGATRSSSKSRRGSGASRASRGTTALGDQVGRNPGRTADKRPADGSSHAAWPRGLIQGIWTIILRCDTSFFDAAEGRAMRTKARSRHSHCADHVRPCRNDVTELRDTARCETTVHYKR